MKTAEELYQEMTEVFAQQTGMEAVAGEAAVRLYALAAQVYGLYAELDWTRKQCFPQTATGEAPLFRAGGSGGGLAHPQGDGGPDGRTGGL